MSIHTAKGTKKTIPDPEDAPLAYQNAETLQHLFVDRGWRRKDICSHFDISDSELRRWLNKHRIEQDVKNTSAPKSGLAKELFERGLEEARG